MNALTTDVSVEGSNRPSASSDRLDWTLMGPILAIVSIDALSMAVMLPLLPFYSIGLGATPFIVGTLFAAFSFCQFGAGPVLGRLSDRYGPKPVLLESQLGLLASLILLALATNLAMVFVARMVGGLTAGNISVASAYTVDRSTVAKRKQAIGVISMGVGVGLIIGPTLSAVSGHISPSIPIWIAAAFSAASILVSSIPLSVERSHSTGDMQVQGARRAPEFGRARF